MKDITTLLFDIDGTILDTREFIIQATEYALKTLCYQVPERSVIAQNVGKVFPDYYGTLSGSSEKIKELIDAHWEFQYSNMHLSVLFPNTLQALKAVKEKGYKLGAVTTRSRKTSKQTLLDSGIFDLFDIVIAGDDVKESKPHPAPLLKALELVGEVPEKAIMIGDSHLDIEAGKNAGTKTIRAIYGFHTDNLHEPEPNFIVEDISELLKLL